MTSHQNLLMVSLQASSDPSCHLNVKLNLFSIFSNGYLHQIWPRPLFAALRSCFLYSATFPRIIQLGELDTIPQPPLSLFTYVQKNATFDVFVSRPMCVSLRFLWDAHWAPRPLQYMVLPVDHIWAEMIYVVPCMNGVARACWRTLWSSSSVWCSRWRPGRVRRVLLAQCLARISSTSVFGMHSRRLSQA